MIIQKHEISQKEHMSQKDHIIEQAMQMFVTQGIKAVRMDDIAQQLGVSKRTLYEMFGDKEALLYLALSRYLDVCEEYHNQLAANASNTLEAMFVVLSDVMENSETTNRLTANLRKFHPAIYNKLMTDKTEKHRRSFRECLDKGVSEELFIKEMNPELAISVLYYTASALITHEEVILPAGMSERQAFRQIISSFFRGISTPKGISLINDYTAEHLADKEETKYQN